MKENEEREKNVKRFFIKLILQAGGEYGKLFNGGSYKSVAEFQAESAGRDNIYFNDTAAPGAPGNSNPVWCKSLLFKPPTGHQVKSILENADWIDWILRGDDDQITEMNFLFAHLL